MTDFATSWSDSDVRILKEYWAQGISASEIRREALPERTRNAIIGKVHRLGLGARRTIFSEEARHQQQLRALHAAELKRMRYVPDVRAKQAIPRKLPLEPPPAAAVKLHELKPQHCRWPVGEPSAMAFCGHRKLDGYSYCQWHAARAYVRGSS